MSTINILTLPTSIISALARIERFFDCPYSSNEHRALYNLDIEVSRLDYGLYLVSVSLDRNDCHKYSPRAVFCNDGGHFIIGKRGAIQVCYQRKVIGDVKRAKEHVAYVAEMVRGKVF